MAESTDNSTDYHQQHRRTIPIIRYGKRLFSQTPTPPSPLILRQITGDPLIRHQSSRKKRAASEQFNRRDR